MVRETNLDRVQLRKREVGENFQINPESNARSILISSTETLEDFLKIQRGINSNIELMETKLKELMLRADSFNSGFTRFYIDNLGSVVPDDVSGEFYFQSGEYVIFNLIRNILKIDVDMNTFPRVNDSRDGLMTKEEHKKLSGIEENANNYIHDKSPLSPGTYLRIKTDDRGHAISGNNDIITITEGGTGANNLTNAKENLEIPSPTVNYVDNGVQNAVSSEAVYKELQKKANTEHGNHVPNSSAGANSLSFLKEGNQWEKIQSASTTQEGVVRLSNETNGTSETKAVTEKALRDAIADSDKKAQDLYNSLVDGADNALDTFKEIGDWVNEHQDLYTNVISSLAQKVDKKTGYGLSKNDLTDTLKQHYDTAYEHSQQAHAPDNAQRNTIEVIKINGEQVIPDSNKVVNIVMPTKVSEFSNDSGFLTTHPSVTKQSASTTDLTFQEKQNIEFTIVNDATLDEFGHVTQFKKQKITIPQLNYIKTIKTGSVNGTVSVDGTDVSVRGLGTAAYKNESDFTKTSVKGNKESTYRTGNVNLTPTNIGALSTDDGGTIKGNVTLQNGDETKILNVRTLYTTVQLIANSISSSIYMQTDESYTSLGSLDAEILQHNGKILISYDGLNHAYNFSGNASSSNITNKIRVLDSDPTNPEVGEIWITK